MCDWEKESQPLCAADGAAGNADRDEFWMRLAIKEAEKATTHGDIPVGAVVVKDGVVIASCHNTRERDKNALRHAEVNAIEEASAKLGGWYLHGCTLYVTLEPCPMCAGAAIQARIPRIVFGAKDEKGGACGGVLDLPSYPFCHKTEIKTGVLAKECAALPKDFFAARRKEGERREKRYEKRV